MALVRWAQRSWGIGKNAGSRRTLNFAILPAIPTLVARWAKHFWPDLVPPEVFIVGGLLMFIFVVAQLLRFVLRAPSVTADVLCASIAAYLMLGLILTLAYWLVDRLTPGGLLVQHERRAAIHQWVRWLLL